MPDDIPSYKEQDYRNLNNETIERDIFRYTRVGYKRKWSGERSYAYLGTDPPTVDDANWKYGAKQAHTIETLLTNQSHANMLRQRYDLVYRSPTCIVAMQAKWKGALIFPFDKARIYSEWGPDISGPIEGDAFECISLEVDGTGTRIILSDLKSG